MSVAGGRTWSWCVSCCVFGWVVMALGRTLRPLVVATSADEPVCVTAVPVGAFSTIVRVPALSPGTTMASRPASPTCPVPRSAARHSPTPGSESVDESPTGGWCAASQVRAASRSTSHGATPIYTFCASGAGAGAANGAGGGGIALASALPATKCKDVETKTSVSARFIPPPLLRFHLVARGTQPTRLADRTFIAMRLSGAFLQHVARSTLGCG